MQVGLFYQNKIRKKKTRLRFSLRGSDLILICYEYRDYCNEFLYRITEYDDSK